MFSRFIAAMLLLILGGCFESANPHVPRSELVQPADLLGYRWSISGPSGDPAMHSFQKGRNGTILWDGDWKDEGPISTQVVRLAQGGVYLFILGAQGESVNYTLLQRWSPGVWTYNDFDLNADPPFGDQNVAYASAVAARHGLRIENGHESHRLEGPVTASAVLGLFRDPDFLGALKLSDRSIFLPSRTGLRQVGKLEVGDVSPYWRMSLSLKDGKLTDLVQPKGLSGQFVDFKHGSMSAPAHVEVKARADGWFDVTGGSDGPIALALLPFDEQGGVYLAVSEGTLGEGEQATHFHTLGLLSREDYGWSLREIVQQTYVLRPAIMAMRSSLLERAAASHGMVWEVGNRNSDWGSLQQVGDGRALLALLHDGQFTSALAVDDTRREQFYNVAALRSTMPDK